MLPSSSSSPLPPPPQTVEAQAIAIAHALIDELQFPYEMRAQDKRPMVARLCDQPPSRKDLSFQTTTKTDNPKFETTPKAVMGPDIADGPDLVATQNLYCMVHGDFTRTSGVDIEHGAPFSGLLKRQEAWIRFLNDPQNKPFSEAFLQVDGVSDFFRQDTDGKIKGTGYLYKICYNSIDNLWLVCHACNIEKGDKDLLAWFAEQDKHFGPDFIENLKKKGGLKTGVLLPMVGGTSVAIVNMDGKDVDIYSGGIGVGKFAREWFF